LHKINFKLEIQHKSIKDLLLRTAKPMPPEKRGIWATAPLEGRIWGKAASEKGEYFAQKRQVFWVYLTAKFPLPVNNL
jgi:hypothetical protein